MSQRSDREISRQLAYEVVRRSRRSPESPLCARLQILRMLASAGAAFLVAVAVLSVLGGYRRLTRATGEGDDQANPTKKIELADLYTRFELQAKFVKSGLQMVIGLVAVLAIAAHIVFSVDKIADAGSALLSDVGIALAAAAVVELAYTLFTPGPDEALNPLMLGVSSGMLLELNSSEGSSVTSALVLLILGVVLGGLFLVRLLLVESKDYKAPDIWWTRHLDMWLEKRTNCVLRQDWRQHGPMASTVTKVKPSPERSEPRRGRWRPYRRDLSRGWNVSAGISGSLHTGAGLEAALQDADQPGVPPRSPSSSSRSRYEKP
jgi:hypothetical protein